MLIEIKIPGAGESVTEAAIGNWLVEDGSYVERDQEIAEVETDKATLPLIASESGKLKILAQQGSKVQIGDVACTIDTEAIAETASKKQRPEKPVKSQATPSVAAATSEEHMQQPKTTPPVSVAATPPVQSKEVKRESTTIKITPLAQKIMDQNELDVEDIITGLKKIKRNDVEKVIKRSSAERIPMSPLRRKLSKRLVAVKNETAMLTTFNEVDMSSVIEMRKKYQAMFQEKYGHKLGMVSFFALACTKALLKFPRVNSSIDGDDIVTPGSVDISIAVQTEKGLMAPVIRNTNMMNLAEIELAINEMADRARTAKLSIEEMTGGTFTITNGGIYGSMLSTPILNPPQSAILGMHNIVERPVAINGKVEIRPIMYVALSYDHRLIDGKESVTFLAKVKEMIETPLIMLMEDPEPEKKLLGL
jgi:2-oxoglutarate dehydrogenase E2 component (dihydrolipoamide succinyltransferase)